MTLGRERGSPWIPLQAQASRSGCESPGRPSRRGNTGGGWRRIPVWLVIGSRLEEPARV